ncbi:MAG: PPC domain-containing protein [Planctomycetota bacterium]|jgi:hypothetical protein
MSFRQILLFLIISLSAAGAWAQPNQRKPHIGYLYPGGGQQGTVVKVIAGGQFLRGATEVYFSGTAVRASVIKYLNPPRNFNREQRQLLRMRMEQVLKKRLSELPEKWRKGAIPLERELKRIGPNISKDMEKENIAKIKQEKLPDHPLLHDLENKSLRELAHITNVFLTSRRKRQFNRQINESVLIKVTIEPDAKPGKRELRIKTAGGLTNPIVFHVGCLPEIRELEPNNRQAYADSPKLPGKKPIVPPAMLNGQIMQGDIDRFRFNAKKGQQLVIETHARSLIPYLADAVPGWFQATLALYDSRGNELAFADDYHFEPDPVLFYKVPKNGQYELEIRDSIYRGRQDFVYRISVGELPFITHTFPLGGKANTETVASIDGWNLPTTKLTLDTRPGGDGIRQAVCRKGKQASNYVPCAVDTLPHCNESESNENIKTAQKIDLPMIVNGRIDTPADVDVFRFKARAGQKVVTEVYARRLNSPLDSLLRLTTASGKVLQWNDDYVIKDGHLHKDITGLITHYADSYLTAELPEDGIYYVHLTDSQKHGGPEYGYRLRIAEPKGDFALRVTPSSLTVRNGGIVPFCVHVLRKDGFDGRIKLVLDDAPAGFEIKGGRIPAGSNRIRMTLKSPEKAPLRPVVLHLKGFARIGGQMVTHPAVPAEDMMQAFLYRHLVPSQELLVSVKKTKWPEPPVELLGRSPVRIPKGGTVRVRMKTRKRKVLKEMQLVLHEPPDGLSIEDVSIVPEGLAFNLRADKDKIQNGFTDNLIIEVFREFIPKRRKGRPAPKKRRYSMGFFPAVPIEIVQK